MDSLLFGCFDGLRLWEYSSYKKEYVVQQGWREEGDLCEI